MDIRILLPRDRTKLGTLEINGQTFTCFGKADNATAAAARNANRNPLYSKGDTPLGEYVWVQAEGQWEPRQSYGPYPPLRLLPKAGQALKAEKNGRTGLAIHSGRLNERGELRPTFGCVRVSDKDMEAITNIIEAAGITTGRCLIEELVAS